MPTDNEVERKAFEAWAKAKFPEMDVARNGDGHYYWSTLNHGWACWQARAAVAPQPEWIVGSDERGTTLRYSPAVAPQPQVLLAAERAAADERAFAQCRALLAERVEMCAGMKEEIARLRAVVAAGDDPHNDACSRQVGPGSECYICKPEAAGDAVPVALTDAELSDEQWETIRRGLPYGDYRGAANHGYRLGLARAPALTDEQCDDMIWSVTRPYACNSGHLDREMYRALIRAGYTAAPAEKKG